jgi:hypothetical protein
MRFATMRGCGVRCASVRWLGMGLGVGCTSVRWLGMGLAMGCVGMRWCGMIVVSGGLSVIRAIVVGMYHPGAAVVSMIGCITTTAGIASSTAIGEAVPSPAVTISPA